MLRLLTTIVILVVAFIPLWIWLGLRVVVNPTTFWEKFVLIGAGLYFLGGIQIFLLIVAGFFLFAVWQRRR